MVSVRCSRVLSTLLTIGVTVSVSALEYILTIGVMVSVCCSRVLALVIRVTVKEILLIRIVITPVILICNQ